MKWENLTSNEIAAFDKNTPVFLNIASIEQHGPHLPVSTDSVLGAFFLDQFDRRDPSAQLVLPQVKICCSDHHMDFPGTLTVPHMVLKEYLLGIMQSVERAGFRKIILFNSHGGNQAIGQVVIEDFGVNTPHCLVTMMNWWSIAHEKLAQLTETGTYGTGHACEFETSLMMVADAVDADLDVPAGQHLNQMFDWTGSTLLSGSRASVFRTMKDISGGSGVVGQPDAASLEKGERIAEAVIEALAEITNDIRAHRIAPTTKKT